MDDTLRRIGPSDLLMLQSVGLPVVQERASVEPSPLPILIAGERDPIPVGATRSCPECGAFQERRETPPNAQGHTLRYWSDCRCDLARAAHRSAVEQYRAQRMQEIDRATLGDPGGQLVAQLTMDAFHREWLKEAEGRHPYDLALRWFAAIKDRDGPDRAGEGPPPALYFHCRGKGRGKTHLAAALLNLARDALRRVAFIEELSYLSRYRHMDFGMAREALLALPGSKAWLTVIDDLGRLEPGKNPASVQNAWNDVISRRYMAQAWTVFTSNYTIDELIVRGTIDDAAYSRIYEMTRGQIVVFDGEDRRLRMQRAS